MQQRYDEVNGIQLNVIYEGEGNEQLIIFLHGFPEFNLAWHKQLPFFANNGFYALAPDQRGYNLSSKPKGVKPYILDNLVADIAGWIKQLTSKKIILVGHDWGGGVAWALAIKHPELLHKLVILNMPHLALMKKHLRSNVKQMFKSWYAAFFQLPVLPELVCRIWNFKFLASSLVCTSNKGTFTREQLEIYKQAWKKPYALTAMLNWYRAFKYDLFKTYHDVSVPTLLIWGKKDATLSVEMATDSVKKCTNGKLVILDDATHWLHHEKPDEVNRLILEFVRS
jgi:pimeloyl-ACP methyl ester carboxylesterase